MAASPLRLAEISPKLLRMQHVGGEKRSISLGIPCLDEALPDSGLPSGSVIELCSPAGLGRSTHLALCACAQAQRESRRLRQASDWTAWIDPCDPMRGLVVRTRSRSRGCRSPTHARRSPQSGGHRSRSRAPRDESTLSRHGDRSQRLTWCKRSIVCSLEHSRSTTRACRRKQRHHHCSVVHNRSCSSRSSTHCDAHRAQSTTTGSAATERDQGSTGAYAWTDRCSDL